MQRKEIAKVFREAKKHLATYYGEPRKARLICLATNATQCAQAHKDMAKGIISERLCDSIRLASWLIERGYPVDDDINNNQGRKLQATRHAWLDSLIEEFEK